ATFTGSGLGLDDTGRGIGGSRQDARGLQHRPGQASQQDSSDSHQHKGCKPDHRIQCETGYQWHAFSWQSSRPAGHMISRQRLPTFLCSFIVMSLKYSFSRPIVTNLPYTSNPSISNNGGVARYRSMETALNNLFG